MLVQASHYRVRHFLPITLPSLSPLRSPGQLLCHQAPLQHDRFQSASYRSPCIATLVRLAKNPRQPPSPASSSGAAPVGPLVVRSVPLREHCVSTGCRKATSIQSPAHSAICLLARYSSHEEYLGMFLFHARPVSYRSSQRLECFPARMLRDLVVGRDSQNHLPKQPSSVLEIIRAL